MKRFLRFNGKGERSSTEFGMSPLDLDNGFAVFFLLGPRELWSLAQSVKARGSLRHSHLSKFEIGKSSF